MLMGRERPGGEKGTAAPGGPGGDSRGKQLIESAGRQGIAVRGLRPLARTDLAAAFVVTAFEAGDALLAWEDGTVAVRFSPGHLAVSVLLGVGVLALLTLIRKARGALPAERASRWQKERELLARRARASERARITRELHDAVGHEMSRIVLTAGILEVTAEQSPEAVRAHARQIGATGRQAMHQMRVLLKGPVREAPAERSSAADGIKVLAERARGLGHRVSLDIADDLDAVPDTVQHSLYRLVQESLTNAFKHAPGAEVTIRVTHRGGWVVVQVSNTGAAGPWRPPMPGSGRGLEGLAHRIRQDGGLLTAGRLTSGGYRITASIPVAAEGSGGVGGHRGLEAETHERGTAGAHS
ncbi:MAG TPA: histidine kinase [Streptomyces sp.]|nr:histidine kinase [Streptomyces sp.]